MAPQGITLDNLANKDDLEEYFDNIAAAVTTEKVVPAQLTAAIASMTVNNKALVATNSKFVADVTTLTRRMGRNSNSAASTNTPPDKRSSKTCPHCKKEGFYKPDTCLELSNITTDTMLKTGAHPQTKDR